MSFLPPSTNRTLPSIYELFQPFQVDPLGKVAQTNNPADWAESHLLALLLTSPGERVMRPTYGVGLNNYVFTNISELDLATITSNIKNMVAQYEPSISIVSVSATPNPTSIGQVLFTVNYSLNNSATKTTQFTVSGQGVEI